MLSMVEGVLGRKGQSVVGRGDSSFTRLGCPTIKWLMEPILAILAMMNVAVSV